MSLIGTHLETFLAIHKTGSIKAASKKLHVTQTCVTQRLQQLEAKIHSQLFIRNSQGVQITESGLSLLKFCHQSQTHENQLMQELHGQTSDAAQTLRVCVSSSFLRTRLTPVIKKLTELYPFLYLHITVSDHKDLIDELKQGAFDLVVVSSFSSFRGIEFKTLRPDVYRLYGSYKWKGQAVRSIITNSKIIDFDSTDQATYLFLKKYNLAKFMNAERHLVNNPETLAYMLEHEMGYSVLTEDFAAPLVESKKLICLDQKKKMEDPLALAFQHNAHLPPYLLELINFLSSATA